MKQPEHKFNELDLWKMLKDKGVPLWIVLEMLQKFVKKKKLKIIQLKIQMRLRKQTRLD